MLQRRLRALSEDERGFTILETVIAITVIFASMVALAYTATIGFKSIAYARERVTFNGVADQIMEEIRGQAYSRIQTGLLSSDMVGDTNILNCGGSPVVYSFPSCSPVEKVVNSGGVPVAKWINPHMGAVAASAITNNIGYSWSTYITNSDPATDPYRVTVSVNWTSAAYPNKANNLVRVQSLFASPSGCVSSATHPFAAPCQPFFYGLAQVPAGQIGVSGSVQGLTFSSGYLQLTGTETNVRNEQVTSGTATYTESRVSVTDALGTRTEGGLVTTASAADSDPNAPGATYQSMPATPIAGVGGTVSSTAGSTSITFQAPAGDAGFAQTAVAAAGANVCPPPTDPAETDGMPCAGGRILQGGTLMSTLDLNGIVGGLGSATLASAASAGIPNESFVDREAVSGNQGRVELTATRLFGTINVGALPSGITAPAGFTSLLIITGYQDSITSQAGAPSTVAPTAAAPSGSVSFWNGAAYTTYAPNSASLNDITSTVTGSGIVGGQNVVVTITVNPGSTAAATGTHQTCTGSFPNALCTDADSSISPFSATVHYVVSVDGLTAVDLNLSLALGSMLTRGVYGQPPTGG
jgi:type II secretory pathway pseudopilin PulG